MVMERGRYMERLKRRQFTTEFKLEAARCVLDQGMSFAEVGKRLGVLPKLVRDWVVKYEAGELVVRRTFRFRNDRSERHLKSSQSCKKHSSIWFGRSSNGGLLNI